ncbi:MAG: DMT family transporter [Alphaproteobacteria bacterium]
MILLMIGAICTGLAPIFVKLSETGPVATAVWRCLLAAPVLLVLAQWQSRGHAVTGKRNPAGWKDWAVLCLPGLFFAGDLGLWHHSILLTKAVNASLLANCQTIFVSLFALLVLKEVLGFRFWLGLALALSGVVLLMWDSLELGGDNLKGDILSIGVAMFYAAYILTVSWLRKRFSAGLIMTCAATVTGLTLLPIALISGEQMLADTLFGWGILIGIAMVAHVGGQNLIAQGLADLPTGFSSVALLVAPVAAGLSGWLILGESMTVLAFIGAGITLTGILIARLATQ